MKNEGLNLASNGEEIIADTPDELAEELQRDALEQQRIAEEKLMNSVAFDFKQCKRDFEILKSDYTSAVSNKVTTTMPRLSDRAKQLINKAEKLHTNAAKVEMGSNSMWRQLMKNALFDFSAAVSDWRNHLNLTLSQLRDGTISWSDVPAITTETSSNKDDNDSKDVPTSGSGDARESHLFTKAGKGTDSTISEKVETVEAVEVEAVEAVEAIPKKPAKRPPSTYSLDYIKVADIPVTANQLKLLGYLRRSANAILGTRTVAGTEIFYIGSISNNLIVPSVYHAVQPLFDTAQGTYFLCTFIEAEIEKSEVTKYVYLNKDGVVEEIPAPLNSHKFTEESTFKIGEHEEEYPEIEEDSVSDSISQKGQLVWVREGNTQYLINSDLGTMLGYSVSANLDDEGLVKLSGVSKIFLSRPSLNTIILRDLDSNKEEYVSMKAKLIFERNAPYVIFIGGIVFIAPHEEKTTVSTFLPYEVEFGNIKSLNANNYREFSNGVLFLKDRILFIDSGDYITQVSQKDLEKGSRGVICINDTLFNYR